MIRVNLARGLSSPRSARRHGGRRIAPQKRRFLALAIALLGASAALIPAIALSQAARGALIVPPEVQAELQALEDRFAAALGQECPNRACVSAGCEVARFRTLDQAQNASLPGLDSSDDSPAPAVQYRLESARCEFAYEPSLSAEAVSALRQRLSEKTRRASVSLSLVGRKLAPPAVVPESDPAKATPAAPAPESPWAGLAKAAPYALILILATAAALSLIWGFRRLGKPKPIVVEASGEGEPADASADESAAEAELRGKVEAKQKELSELFASRPDLVEGAFEPMVEAGEAAELCLALRCFGAEALGAFAGRDESAALFAEVRRRYAEGEGLTNSAATLAFLEKVERLATLARLGKGQPTLAQEFEFLAGLEAEEFSSLVRDLDQDELVAALAFAPERLRASCLASWPAEVAEAFARHVSRNRSVPDQSVRALARRLRDQLGTRKTEIKRAAVDRLPLLQHLLDSLDSAKRARVIAGLKVDQPSLYERLMNESVFEGAIAHASPEVLNDAFLALDPDEAASYLESHPDRDAILAKLKGPLAQALKRRMQAAALPLGGRRIGLAGASFVERSSPEAERARRKLAAALREKSASGAVNLRRLNESVMGLH